MQNVLDWQQGDVMFIFKLKASTLRTCLNTDTDLSDLRETDLP